MQQSGCKMKDKCKSECWVVRVTENRKEKGEGGLEVKRQRQSQCQYLSNYSCNPVPYRSDIYHLPTPNSVPDFLFISAAPSSLVDLLLLTTFPLCRYELYLNTSGQNHNGNCACRSVSSSYSLSISLISICEPRKL